MFLGGDDTASIPRCLSFAFERGQRRQERESLGLSLQMTRVRVVKPWLNNVNDKTFLVISYEFLSSGTVNKPG